MTPLQAENLVAFGGTSLAWFRDPDGNLLSIADTPTG
jgi:hypothetical protein